MTCRGLWSQADWRAPSPGCTSGPEHGRGLAPRHILVSVTWPRAGQGWNPLLLQQPSQASLSDPVLAGAWAVRPRAPLGGLAPAWCGQLRFQAWVPGVGMPMLNYFPFT